MATQPKGRRSVWWTSDIEIAAYLQHRGLEHVTARRKQKGGRFEIGLADPDGRADDLADEYLNSPEFGFAHKLQGLRKRLLDRRRNGSGHGGT